MGEIELRQQVIMRPGNLMLDRAYGETVVGSIAAVLFLLVVVLSLFIRSGDPDRSAETGLWLTADFNRIDGLNIGSPVRVAGLNVGNVTEVAIGAPGRATVVIRIEDSTLPIPLDTAAVIETDGIFGEKYIELHPGGEFENLKSGQRFSYAQDSVVLESLLNQIVAQAKARRQPDNITSLQGEEQ